MGLDRYKSYRDNRVYLNSDNTISFDVSGYDKSIDISYTTYTNIAQFSPESMGINNIEFSKDNKALIVNYDGDEVEFNISKIYKVNYESNVPVAQEDLTFYSETESGKYKLIINSINYEKGSRIETMRGLLLVGGRE
jgi:WD40 repeat protein